MTHTHVSSASMIQSLHVSVDIIAIENLRISRWCHIVPNSLYIIMITGRHEGVRYTSLSKMWDFQLVYIIHLATETGNCGMIHWLKTSWNCQPDWEIVRLNLTIYVFLNGIDITHNKKVRTMTVMYISSCHFKKDAIDGVTVNNYQNI